ncbi:unnamed protein product [Prunus brigantina]
MRGLVTVLQERCHQIVLTHQNLTLEVRLKMRYGRVDKLRHTTSKWLCDRYVNKLKRNSNFDLKSFQEDVLEDYKINVTKIQVYRANRLVRNLNEGTFKEQYARLWDYAE